MSCVCVPGVKEVVMRRGLNAFLILVLCGFTAASRGQFSGWQSAAKWHQSLKRAVPGTLLLDENGVEFQSAKLNRRWAYVDIHSFDVSLHDLTLFTYESRPWDEPGGRPV